MKYLYYSLYLFYVKVIQLHKQYPPIINVTAVMSVLVCFLIFAIPKEYFLRTNFEYFKYLIFVEIVLNLFLWKFLYEYYKPREGKLLKEMETKPLWLKVVIISLSVFFTVIAVKLWMFDGASELYQWMQK